MTGTQFLRFLITTKARSDDHFIMRVTVRQVTVTTFKGMDSLTTMTYQEFEPGTFSVATGSPNHYTA